MSDHTRHDDLEVLGISADASPLEAAKAYRELRDLYSEDSLATYSLLTPEEREAILGRIEEAHARLSRRPATPTVPEVSAEAYHEETPEVDPSESPGCYLRRCREAKGLTIRDVADETKIGSRHLENIENEDYRHLPVRVYLRGFLIAYARALRLPRPQEAAEIYLARYERECPQDA